MAEPAIAQDAQHRPGVEGVALQNDGQVETVQEWVLAHAAQQGPGAGRQHEREGQEILSVGDGAAARLRPHRTAAERVSRSRRREGCGYRYG